MFREKVETSLNRDPLSLGDLLDVENWQKIQDNFSAVTGVNLRTVDADCRPFTKPSAEPRLCSQVLKEAQQKEKICGSCLPTFLGGRWIVDKNLSYKCEVGLCNFAAPLKLRMDRALGYVLAGPVILVKRKPKEEYRGLAEELNIDIENLWGALLEIKVISFHGVESMLELIQDVCEYALSLAYKNLMKQKEVVMAIEPAKLNKIFEALLDVAFEVTNADVGSVMLLDRVNDALTIRASRGITDEIVRNTKVRLGDGISGLAAKEGKSFIIDQDIKDNRIRRYLNRPQITSSMVLSLKSEDKVVGVMNLGVLGSSQVKFSPEKLSLINRLVDLAVLALY